MMGGIQFWRIIEEYYRLQWSMLKNSNGTEDPEALRISST